MKKNFYTIPEAAKICVVGRTTMWRWVKSGRLKAAAGPGGHYRILKNDLHSFARRQGISPVSGTHFTGARILVVDDDATIRDVLLQFLTESGYLVTVAVDGFDTGIKVSEFKPELILMDLIMPGMDGVEACRRIKDNPGTSGIRVLMITGFDTPENREKAKQAGADGYLVKPIGRNVLLEKVKDLLSIRSDRW
ncbi:MAG: response regulator [Desulfobacterales bacterium]|nr:response regulator [Desulfobacterales bacterium]